jgi:hypothetical protein
MGRFYKTASPQMVDFMYKIPEQALLKAIEGTDKQIDTENLYVTESQKLLQKKSLSPDEARQVELIKQHQQGIDEVSQLLASSPLAALKDRQKVRALQKKIYEDVTRGELGAQYKNYDIRQKHLEEETKRATDKDGNIRIEDVNRAMAAFDKAFADEKKDEQGNIINSGGTAYDPTTGTYRSYSPEKLVNFYDRKKEFENIAKDWKPSTDTDIKKEFVQGNYYVTTRNKDKLLPLNELTWGIYKTMMLDPRAISYNTQQARIGSSGDKKLYNQEMTRLFGERVDPDNPFSAFKMVEVKDAEGKTKMQKVQKYDKDGKPEMKDGKPVTEEIPVMEMANPGELFLAAQVAADKQDINEVVREQSLDLTEQAKSAIDQAKEIAVAKAKNLIENPITVMDVRNNQIVSQRLPGNSYAEIKSNLTKSKDGLTLMKDKLKESYLQTLKTSIGSLGSSAAEQTKVKNEIDNFINTGNYAGLEKYLQDKKIELPNVSQAAKAINSAQVAINNNERLFKIQEDKVLNSKEYKEFEKRIKNTFGPNSPLTQATLDNYINTNFKNDVSQGVETVQGQKWREKNLINDAEQAELNIGFNYIKKNPLEFLTSLGQATNAVINKVDSKGKVTQSFTNINDLLGSYGIALTQTAMVNTEGDTEELIYTIPGSKEKLAVRINRASVVDGNTANVKVQTAKGTSEPINLGSLPLNVNMEILKIDAFGNKVPQNVDILTSRDNVRVSNINNVINNSKNIGAASHVQAQVNKAEGSFEGLGTGTEHYLEDEYGVKFYPNEAEGTTQGKVIVPNPVGGVTEAYGDQGIQLYINYVKQQK